MSTDLEAALADAETAVAAAGARLAQATEQADQRAAELRRVSAGTGLAPDAVRALLDQVRHTDPGDLEQAAIDLAAAELAAAEARIALRAAQRPALVEEAERLRLLSVAATQAWSTAHAAAVAAHPALGGGNAHLRAARERLVEARREAEQGAARRLAELTGATPTDQATGSTYELRRVSTEWR